MSEARNHRFEIDIDEIERQLRRSIEEQPAAKPDPLAELARIVGQDDPFRGILARDAAPAAQRPTPPPALPPAYPQGELPPNVHVFQRPAPPAAEPQHAPARYDDMRSDEAPQAYAPAPQHAEAQAYPQHAYPQHAAPQEPLYDPVAETYGSQDAALAEEDFQPLRPRRSRGRLALVMAGLLVTVGAVAGGLYLKGSGGLMSSSGPKLITADTSPLKVAPENPGGLDVPNQDRKIYEQPGSRDGPSRVVDGREQPIDVRAAARNMPAPSTPGTVSARAPVSSAPDQPAAEGGSAVASALGDPRRVRTVAVNPDGTQYGARTPVATSPTGALVPGGDVPPPVSVSTVPVSSRTAAAAPAPVQPPAAPAAAPPPPAEPAAPPVVASAGTPNSLAPVMDVLPPKRPRLDAKTATEAPVRTASLPAEPAKPKPVERPAAEKPAADNAAAGRANYSVQIAVRPSEQEARDAWSQAQDKFGTSLENKPARLTTAKVGGKTVHRVRLGPMTKADADAMCGRLKAKGGACFVAQN